MATACVVPCIYTVLVEDHLQKQRHVWSQCVLFSCCTVVENTSVEEVGNGNDSDMVLLDVPLTGHQRNSPHAVLRNNPKTTVLAHPLDKACPTVADGLVMPQLDDCHLETPRGTSQQQTQPTDDALGETQEGRSPSSYQLKILPPQATTNNQPTSEEPVSQDSIGNWLVQGIRSIV